MADIVIPFNDKPRKQHPPIPTGPQIVGCYAIYDIGHQHSQYLGQPKVKHKVIFAFELPEHRIKIEKDGVEKDLPRAISWELTASMFRDAPFRKMLESWLGQKFDEKSEKAFSLAKVLGCFGLGNITHKPRNDGVGVWENIETIMPMMKGMPKRTCENPLVMWRVGDDPMDKIPQWIQKKAMQSDEWKAKDNPPQVEPPIREPDEVVDDDTQVPF